MDSVSTEQPWETAIAEMRKQMLEMRADYEKKTSELALSRELVKSQQEQVVRLQKKVFSLAENEKKTDARLSSVERIKDQALAVGTSRGTINGLDIASEIMDRNVREAKKKGANIGAVVGAGAGGAAAGVAGGVIGGIIAGAVAGAPGGPPGSLIGAIAGGIAGGAVAGGVVGGGAGAGIGALVGVIKGGADGHKTAIEEINEIKESQANILKAQTIEKAVISEESEKSPAEPVEYVSWNDSVPEFVLPSYEEPPAKESFEDITITVESDDEQVY